ncbi:MAG: hypothetical protein R3E18_08285 [Sphingomonadaceae bacterium]|nr:hypothetical protein [Sphingomonadaceae bacterium]
MRLTGRRFALSAATLAVAASGLAIAPQVVMARTLQEKAAAQLDRLLEDREAGEPLDCLFLPSVGHRLQVLHRTALVFGSGKTIYVNNTEDPEFIDRGKAIRIKSNSRRLCDYDTASNGIRLDKFIPFTRIAKPEAVKGEAQ